MISLKAQTVSHSFFSEYEFVTYFGLYWMHLKKIQINLLRLCCTFF